MTGTMLPCRVVPGSLWAALGRPSLEGLLPSGGSSGWLSARASFDNALRDWGTGWRPGSPAALWQALNGFACPRGATWGDLIEGVQFRQVLVMARGRLLGKGAGVACWNARWMVDKSSDAVSRKREAVRGWLDRGRVVALQETHWGPEDVLL